MPALLFFFAVEIAFLMLLCSFEWQDLHSHITVNGFE
jgi:hypothetical protein